MQKSLCQYLSNFWKSLEIPLINYKIELNLTWTKYCVFSDNEVNDNDKANNIIFNIKDMKLYVPVVTLSARHNQKWSRIWKGFERSVYWNENITKTEYNNTTYEYRYCPESIFVWVNRLFVLVYTNEANNAKKFNDRKHIYQKEQ